MYHPKIDNHFKNEKVIKLSDQIKELVNGLIQGVEEIKKIELK